MNLIFIHEHNVNISTAKKISNNCYSIDGYLDAKKNDNMKLKAFDIYFSIYCRKCDKYLLKTRASQDFVVISKKMTGLKNYFNDQGKIESVYLDDNPSKNILDSEDAIRLPFYKLNTMPIYDNKTIYVGTDEEQKDFFHQKYIELKNKSDDISKKEQEIKKYDGGIIIKEDSKKLPEAYHIIIGANSILSLNNDGWEIKYPKKKEVYEDLKTKPMIIVGVVGNRNKGKSFILGKLTDYKVPQGFSIKTEGISVCFGDKEDHCIAILDSAGQEVPLLQSANNLKEKNKEKENKKQNEIKIENDKENIKEGNDKENIKEEKALNETKLLEKCLRDKLITEKFLEEFIIHTSDVLILVVGNITLNEQKILTRIKNSLQKEKKNIYVIHNLQNYQRKEQVEDYIENTLKKLYGIKIVENSFQNIKGDYHKKYYVEEREKITHLIFINDYCIDADYYNYPTIEFLKKNLDVVQNRTHFSVVEKCKEFFLKIQSEFLEEPITNDDFEKNENKIKVNKKDIKLKKVFIDEIGKTIANDPENPNYYYYTEKNDLIINVELPGPNPSIKTKMISEGEFYIFSFTGEKSGNTSDNKEKHILSKNLKDKVPFKFSILIPKKDITILPNDKGKLQFYERSEQNDQGIFTFKYHISNMDEADDYE